MQSHSRVLQKFQHIVYVEFFVLGNKNKAKRIILTVHLEKHSGT
jgi:hypothetical protein